MKRLFVIFDGPPSQESGRFVEVEDEKGASHGNDVGIGWEHVSPFSGPDTWRLGPFLSVKDAGEIAENAIGLFLERARDHGLDVPHPRSLVFKDEERGWIASQREAVMEVVQGVEADVTP